MLDHPPISGKRVKGLRERLGIKQKDMAAYLGIGVSTLQQIERNLQNPSLITLIGLVKILTGDSLGPLIHQGLSDVEEYNDARYGDPRGLAERAAGWLEDLRPETGMPVHVRGGRDNLRRPVQPLRGSVRPDPRGA